MPASFLPNESRAHTVLPGPSLAFGLSSGRPALLLLDFLVLGDSWAGIGFGAPQVLDWWVGHHGNALGPSGWVLFQGPLSSSVTSGKTEIV